MYNNKYNNNLPIMLGSTLADNHGCDTIPVQIIELHQVVDRKDCSSDFFFFFFYQILNSVAKHSSAYHIKLKYQFDKLSLEIKEWD